MKISYVKLANAIKCGTKTADNLLEKDFDMTLDGVVIRVTEKKSNKSVFTSLFNAVYWTGDEAKPAETKKGK